LKKVAQNCGLLLQFSKNPTQSKQSPITQSGQSAGVQPFFFSATDRVVITSLNAFTSSDFFSRVCGHRKFTFPFADEKRCHAFGVHQFVYTYCVYFFHLIFLPQAAFLLRSFMNSAMAAWYSGHRVRLQNRRSRVRIPPGCKVF
jgi:hypothetical protein